MHENAHDYIQYQLKTTINLQPQGEYFINKWNGL